MVKMFKLRKSYLIIFTVLILMVSSVFAYAAMVGDQLTFAAEEGWQRIENTNPSFSYLPSGWTIASQTHYSGGSSTYATAIGSSIQFNFTGDKIRLIFSKHENLVTADVNIDGVITNVSFGSGVQPRTLVYENLTLSDQEHYCIITSTAIGASSYFDFDAIEIDNNAEIKSYDNTIAVTPNTPSDLSVTAGDSQIDLTWTAITDATGYNVKRATIAGGPYNTIANNITASDYTDSSVTNDTTYYYVVSAINAEGESLNSNEVSVTPIASVVTGNAILVITMTNGNVKEYDLSMTEVNDFIDWYDERAAGSGEAYFIFNKDYNLGPYQSQNEYIVFEAISSFEVKQY